MGVLDELALGGPLRIFGVERAIELPVITMVFLLSRGRGSIALELDARAPRHLKAIIRDILPKATVPGSARFSLDYTTTQ
jgi:hypothetical protein